MRKFTIGVVAIIGFCLQLGCQRQSAQDESSSSIGRAEGFLEDDLELEALTGEFRPLACKAAVSSQIQQVNAGNRKRDLFLTRCHAATQGSPWCLQLLRPNPSSRSIFACTYGSEQPHMLIHPNEATWKNAFAAVNLVEELESKGIHIDLIYNWWRPEPYNKNVGGAAGRHPFGTSVDVRFATKSDQEKAHKALCQIRHEGRLRALGYYSSTALHFGVGDSVANTWGKGCP